MLVAIEFSSRLPLWKERIDEVSVWLQPIGDVNLRSAGLARHARLHGRCKMLPGFDAPLFHVVAAPDERRAASNCAFSVERL